MPTAIPVTTAQLIASSKGERRSASTLGGVEPRNSFQGTSMTRCVASPTRAPRPIVTTFQPYFFAMSTLSTYPDDTGLYRNSVLFPA